MDLMDQREIKEPEVLTDSLAKKVLKETVVCQVLTREALRVQWACQVRLVCQDQRANVVQKDSLDLLAIEEIKVKRVSQACQVSKVWTAFLVKRERVESLVVQDVMALKVKLVFLEFQESQDQEV